MRSRFNIHIFLVIFFLAASAGAAAWAACSSPAASVGGRDYFTNNTTYKLCDGTNWQDFLCPDSSWTATLKGYWKLDETSGNPIDTTAANTTTQSNGTWAATSGYRDGAMSFNGTTSYVNGASAAAVDTLYASAGLSVSAWIYPTGLGENSNGQIIGKDNGTTNAAATGWILRLTGTNRIHFSHDYTAGANTDVIRESTDNAITLNAWNHVVLTWTGSATATNAHIYVNGTEVTYATSQNGATTRSSDAAQSLLIGNNRVASNSRTFAGFIDEVYIFDGILSATEISTLKSRGCVRLGSCATPAQMEYDATKKYYKYCDGTNSLIAGCVAAPPSGLIGHWKLDETSGNTIADSSGNGYTGTWLGGANVVSTTGKVNTGLLFAGGTDQINLGSAAALDNLSALTVCAWHAYGSAPDDGYAEIMNKSTNGLDGWNFFDSTSFLGFQSGLGDYTISTTNFLADNAYHHVCATWDGTDGFGGIVLYNNGAAVASSGTVMGGIFNDAAINLVIGGTDSTPSTYRVNGSLDDVWLYNRALSATEIQQLFASALSNISCGCADVPFSGLLAHWKFDETSGTSVADSSGNGYNGTWSGAANVSATGGRINGAFTFDGVDDKVTVTSNAFDNLAAMTACMWINQTNAPDGYANVISKFNGIGWNLYTNNTGVLGYQNNLGDWTQVSAGLNGVWSYVCGTWDGTDNYTSIKLYKNGTDITIAGGNDSNIWDDSPNDLAIGMDIGGAFRFAGMIDEVRVYNRALSGPEMALLYQLSLVPACIGSTSCTGDGKVEYDSSGAILKWCDGTAWHTLAQ